MNKWFQTVGLMLLAALVCDLSGCAQTSGWLAKKSSKKTDDEKLADSDKKSSDKDKDKTAKKKTDKELADAKAGKSKDKTKDKSKDDTAVAKAKTDDGKSKAVDAEHEKYAAAERQKRKKAAAKPEDDNVELASNTKADKPKKATAATIDSPKTDDELDQFLAKSDESATASKKKKPATEDSFDDIIAAADDRTPTKKNVVQVKKEVAKSDGENSSLDWADNDASADSKQVKSANAAESFEDELESPFDIKARAKEREAKKVAAAEKVAVVETPSESFDDDANEFASPPKKKSAVGKQTRGTENQSYVAQCPNASPELRELLTQMETAEVEGLRQCLFRIGQMDRDGVAAISVLRKMLKHEDVLVRAHAALAMTRLNLGSSESEVVVIEVAKSSDAKVRSFGMQIIDEMGPQSTNVLNALGECLNDRDGHTRIHVAEVLIRHEKWSYPALKTLLACLQDKDESVRWMTAYSLADLCPEDSPETVQALIKATHDKAPRVQCGAVWALCEIGPSAKRATEDLRKLRASTNDAELREAIDGALKEINK